MAELAQASASVRVEWDVESGKPLVAPTTAAAAVNSAASAAEPLTAIPAEISFSHMGPWLLMVGGARFQGCDLCLVEPRDWQSTLGPAVRIDEVLLRDHSYNRAGSIT